MAKKTTKIVIDPGSGGSGYSIWDMNWNLLSYGNVFPKEKEIWEIKVYEVAEELKRIAQKWRCNEGHIEYPAFFMTHNSGGVASSGALVKLAFFTGVVCGTMPFLVKILKVSEWKGNLPKKVVINRIKKILPTCKAKSHSWDSIGMALYLSGRFK